MNKINEQATNQSLTINSQTWNTKAYFTFVLCLSLASATYAQTEELITQDVTREIEIEQTAEEKTQQDIDQELFEIFNKFFDEKDTTPFTKLIGKVVSLLKLKKATFNDEQKKQCEDIIASFEKNRHNNNPVIWGTILKDPNLYNLMPEKSKAYINSIPAMKKLQALIYKLRNNFHSFF